MFSSARGDWETPDDLYGQLDAEFHFTLDVCANASNAKCIDFLDHDTGLSSLWHGTCWMNPPYGRRITAWIEKAYMESIVQGNATVVCLLPARTDTKWFHNYCVHGEIRFLKGRLRFKGAEGSAPFPSMIVVFRPGIPLEITWENTSSSEEVADYSSIRLG